ncbi:MAG: hypothetical protein M1816_006785 [Peltula sp. TS41687]|nr:MAG: hypothetical protein M1816_006785 [Peltula sp. TS41687]
MSPRSRKKSSSNLRRDGGRLQDGSLRNMFVSAKDQTLGAEMGSPGRRTPSGHGTSKFTLMEEGRNTEFRHKSSAVDSHLRHHPIAFLSAGQYDSSKELNTKLFDEEADLIQLDSCPATDEHDTTDRQEVLNEPKEFVMALRSRKPEPKEDQPLFVVDVEGSKVPINTGFTLPKYPPPSPTLSSSSHEIVMYTGRQSKTDLLQTHLTEAHARQDIGGTYVNEKGYNMAFDEPERSFNSGVTVIDDPSVSLDMNTTDATIDLAVTPINEANLESVITPIEEAHGMRKSKSQSRRERRAKLQSKAREGDESMLDDYIKNTREHGEDLGDLLGDEGDATVPEASVSQDESTRGGWESEDLRDFDHLSTSDEVMDTIHDILSKRIRPSGLQYLVVWEGQAVDDARWILSSSLTMAGASEHIQAFEKVLMAKACSTKAVYEATDDSDSDWIPNPLDGSDENSEDENERFKDVSDDEEHRYKDNEDHLQRKVAKMSDEKLARLLSKQEELGMGSDELLLYDDDLEDDGYEADDNDGQAETENVPYSTFTRTTLTLSPRSKRGLTAATASDPYGDFDIMDRDRPSLQKKGKGRGPALPFELSDPELQANLQASWEKDRSKKSARKQEREELRAQGLLGSNKKKDKAGPHSPYSNSVEVQRVKAQIKSFLRSSDEVMALPPMDHRARKLVHELANAFGLKSKSMGNGQSRYPNLIKTRDTGPFDQAAFEAVEDNLIGRVSFMRLVYRPPSTPKKPAARQQAASRGNARNAAVSYRDGDIVGAAAPELGVENKGRAMMERMGWSQGTALGAMDNKGILTPVTHVVKTSKAGLG